MQDFTPLRPETLAKVPRATIVAATACDFIMPAAICRSLRSVGRTCFRGLLGAGIPLAFALHALVAPAQPLRTAPPLSATLLDGTSFSLSEANGRVVLVNFWATWCAPCRLEMPALDRFYREHRARGLVVLAISLDEPAARESVRAALQGFSFQAALGAQARYRGYGRIWRVPTTFVIDRQGLLREDLTVGTLTIDAKFLEQRVAPLLEP